MAEAIVTLYQKQATTIITTGYSTCAPVPKRTSRMVHSRQTPTRAPIPNWHCNCKNLSSELMNSQIRISGATTVNKLQRSRESDPVKVVHLLHAFLGYKAHSWRRETLSNFVSPFLRESCIYKPSPCSIACWGGSSHIMGPVVSFVHSRVVDGNALQKQ